MFLLLETYLPVIKKLPKWITRIYTLMVVCVGFVMFRADSVGDGLFMIKQMFTGFSFDVQTMSFALQQMTPWFIVMVMIGMIGMAPIRGVADRIRGIVETSEITGEWNVVQIILYLLSVLLLCWCMIRLSGSTYNPFIYFRF